MLFWWIIRKSKSCQCYSKIYFLHCSILNIKTETTICRDPLDSIQDDFITCYIMLMFRIHLDSGLPAPPSTVSKWMSVLCSRRSSFRCSLTKHYFCNYFVTNYKIGLGHCFYRINIGKTGLC